MFKHAPKRQMFIAIALAMASQMANANPKIDAHAVQPITKKEYPNFYAQWGPKGIKKINALMPLAAKKVAESPQCDRVDLVELSGQRSVPGKSIIFFVDCRNNKRFYVSEADLQSSAKAQSQESKIASLSPNQAMQMCDNTIKAKLKNPLTYNRNSGSTKVIPSPTTGRMTVEFVFEAKNDLGASLPQRAKCIFSDRGIEEASIFKS